MTELNCLKVVFIFKLLMEAFALNNVIVAIQKMMSPRKSEENVMTNFCKS